jgi:predicted GNAT family acetyltransferase
MQQASIRLHSADYVYHFTEANTHALLQEVPHTDVRQLSLADEAVFTDFQSLASEQDLDDAYVELDHWAVFGSFEHGRLVSAASMYPWSGAKIADLGVLTLPTHRGMGHARGVVRAISRFALEQGYEPQYRCQTDNAASVSLAKSAGLALFGTWEVVSPECTICSS